MPDAFALVVGHQDGSFSVLAVRPQRQARPVSYRHHARLSRPSMRRLCRVAVNHRAAMDLVTGTLFVQINIPQ